MNPVHTCTVRRGPICGVYAVQMRSNRAFDKHWHDTYGFGLMDEGGQVSASGRGQVRALAGQIITTNPSEVHDSVPLQQHARSWRMVFVTPECLAELVGQSEVELSKPVWDDAVLCHAFDQLFGHWNTRPTADEQSILEELLTQACGLMVLHYSSKPMADSR